MWIAPASTPIVGSDDNASVHRLSSAPCSVRVPVLEASRLCVQECHREAVIDFPIVMKVKLKRAVHSNSLIDEFTNKVLQCPAENLHVVLANFKWVYDKVSEAS